MRIDKLHNDIQLLARKSGHLYLEPEDIDAAINRASLDKFKKYFGLPEDYQPGRPVPKIAYEQTKKVSDAMRVFKVKASLVPDVNGKVTIPANYVHTSMIAYQPTAGGEEVEVKEVDDARWVSRINRITSAPSLDLPVCNFQATEIEVRPKTLPNIKLTYLKLPTTAAWGYTVDADGNHTFNAGTSTDLDWPEIEDTDILAGAISYLGLAIEDGDMVSYGEMRKQKGE